MKDLRHTDERSVVSLEDDERSNCTSATTASLASRIQSLAVDFGPKHRQRTYDQFVEDEEEEDMISIPEEELLKELERQEPAFQVEDCSIVARMFAWLLQLNCSCRCSPILAWCWAIFVTIRQGMSAACVWMHVDACFPSHPSSRIDLYTGFDSLLSKASQDALCSSFEPRHLSISHVPACCHLGSQRS